MRRYIFLISALLASTPAFAVLDITPTGNKPPPSADVSATLKKSADDCSSGNGCSLTVSTEDGKTAFVVLNEGDSVPTCKINQQAAKDAMAIPTGTSVIIHVDDLFRRNKQSHDFYYLCGDDAAVTAK